jgi:hypothetical protein
MKPALKVKQRRRRHARKPAPVTFPELESCFANRFNVAWRKAVEGIIESGKILAEAKEALSGRFIGFVQSRLGMSPRTAERLMAIAADTWITDSTHVSSLPPSWGTLYQIATLAVPERERLVEAGIIRPDMERADIEKEIRRLRGSGSAKRKNKIPAQPVAESWAQSKPPVERMLAKQAENAEVEADALAAEEVEAEACCCSFCDRADVDHLVGNAANTAFICWECGVQAAAYLPPQWRGRAFKALIGDVMVTVAHRPPEEPPQSPKRERPKGSKKTKRVAPALIRR